MYIKLYRASNNTELSGEGVFTNAVEFTLRADLNESGSVRLYAEADTGYKVTGTTVQPVGTTAAKWALAPDAAGSEGTYGADGASLSLGEVAAGAGGRVFFWAKAKATSDESPANDSSVLLECEGVAEAV